jgi:hypothetical protein
MLFIILESVELLDYVSVPHRRVDARLVRHV